MLQIEGAGNTDVLGPIRFRASVPRTTMATSVQIDLPAIPVGADLMRRAIAAFPEASCLNQVSGLAEVHVKLQTYDEGPHPFSYEISTHLRKGRYCHPQLPGVLEDVDLEAQCCDGRVSVGKLSAKCGSARMSARVADLRLPECKAELEDIHRLVRELDVGIEHLNITPTILDRFPEQLRFIRKDYSPAGPLSVHYTYRQAGESRLVKECLVEPEGMDACFDDFPYPLKQVRGKIRVDLRSLPGVDVAMDLSAQAGGKPVTLKGSVKGDKKTPELYLDIRGSDVLLDDKIMDALSPDRPVVSRIARVAQQFLPEQSRLRGLGVCPMGKADIQALIRRTPGQQKLDRRFTISFKDSSMKFDQFPYQLDKVSGVLIVHSDHWECKNFHGFHAGGQFFVEGWSEAMPDRAPVPASDGSEGSRPEIVRIFIRGQDVLLDSDLERALSPRTGNERKMLQETCAHAGSIRKDAIRRRGDRPSQ